MWSDIKWLIVRLVRQWWNFNLRKSWCGARGLERTAATGSLFQKWTKWPSYVFSSHGGLEKWNFDWGSFFFRIPQNGGNSSGASFKDRPNGFLEMIVKWCPQSLTFRFFWNSTYFGRFFRTSRYWNYIGRISKKAKREIPAQPFNYHLQETVWSYLQNSLR